MTLGKYKRLIVDAGHGGYALGIYTTAGKRSPEPPPVGIYEGEFNRRFASRLCELAEEEGFEVVNLIGNTVCNVKLGTRCETEHLFHTDDSLFISIHVNAIGDVWQERAAGLRVMYHSNSGREVAESIAREFNAVTVRRDDLYVLKNTKSTAVLVELGFMDNKTDLTHVTENIDKYCNYIIRGIK